MNKYILPGIICPLVNVHVRKRLNKSQIPTREQSRYIELSRYIPHSLV